MENISTNNISIGHNFIIHETASIKCDQLIIGDNVIIDERTKIICKNGIVVIGDNTYIGNDVTVVLKSLEIGEYTKLHNHCLLNGKASVKIGHNCWIGQNCNLNGEADLIIGNNVGIGTYSSIWTHGYFGELIEGCTIFSIKPTIIEDDVWLVGSYNTIFPGVTLKKKTVLFGTSVITKSTLENNVYSGNPAQNITSKVGEPYRTLSVTEKTVIIKKALLENLPNAVEIDENKIQINGLGLICFLPKSIPDLKNENLLCFIDFVESWSTNDNISLFCLSSKLYSKKKTPLEVAVRKVLNPVTARFIPLENNVINE
jgi:acetyltransferase-like isoleucine patch superfamily enzyme